jgi:hypothetical protein
MTVTQAPERPRARQIRKVEVDRRRQRGLAPSAGAGLEQRLSSRCLAWPVPEGGRILSQSSLCCQRAKEISNETRPSGNSYAKR